MTFIPEEKIQEIRDRASIVSVVSQYVSLKKSGVNYKGNCPFHSEQTPSFMVSEVKKIYHCFGCGKGGNVFSFLMEHARLSFPEAVQKLAGDLGIPLAPVSNPTQDKEKRKTELLYKINKLVLNFFKDELKKSPKALSYLKKRGMSSNLVAEYHVGYAPEGWSHLLTYLKKKGVSESDSLHLGLVVRKEDGKMYDRFRDRIIFPLFDLSQRVLGFGGRSLSEEAMPKYLNSSESQIYHKSHALYGLSHGVQDVSRRGVILVEGYFDCLALHQAGFKNAAATMGTSLTEGHIHFIKRMTDQFYILFDQDEAGKNAAERSLTLFLKEGILPKMIDIRCPGEFIKDPDDFFKKYSKKDFEAKLNHSKSLLYFVMERILQRYKHESSYKTKVIQEISVHIRQMPDGIEREEAIQWLADRLQVQEQWIMKSLSGSKDQKKENKFQNGPTLYESSLETQLLEFIVIFPQLLDDVIHEKVLDLFMDLEVKDILFDMIDQRRSHQMDKQTIDFSSILEKINNLALKEALLHGIFKKDRQSLTEKEWRPVYEGLKTKLQKKCLETKEKELLERIKDLDGSSVQVSEEGKRHLLSEYQRLVLERKRL